MPTKIKFINVQICSLITLHKYEVFHPSSIPSVNKHLYSVFCRPGTLIVTGNSEVNLTLLLSSMNYIIVKEDICTSRKFNSVAWVLYEIMYTAQ